MSNNASLTGWQRGNRPNPYGNRQNLCQCMPTKRCRQVHPRSFLAAVT